MQELKLFYDHDISQAFVSGPPLRRQHSVQCA